MTLKYVNEPSVWTFNESNVWLALAFAVVIATVTGYILLTYASSQLPPSMVATYNTAQPIIGTSLAVMFLHESVCWQQGIGGGLIIMGLLCTIHGQKLSASSKLTKEHPSIDSVQDQQNVVLFSGTATGLISPVFAPAQSGQHEELLSPLLEKAP